MPEAPKLANSRLPCEFYTETYTEIKMRRVVVARRHSLQLLAIVGVGLLGKGIKMGYFNNTPLPEGLDVEEAVSRGDMYYEFHLLFIRELESRVTESEFHEIKNRAEKCRIKLRRVGDAIHESHGAYIQREVDQDFHNGKTFKKIALAMMVAAVTLGFLFEHETYLYGGLSILLITYLFYRNHIAVSRLIDSENRHSERERELKSVSYDLEEFCPAYEANWHGTEMLAVVFLLSSGKDIKHYGLIDEGQLPKCMRPSEKVAQIIIDRYGANFESYDDPRRPYMTELIIWFKLIAANTPIQIMYEICEKIYSEYGYDILCRWDYADFLININSDNIKRIEIDSYA